ncbi:MAG: alpha/beta hydrolase [Rhodocyclales bacterium]|nr:alpha/beta hydrolase [Rhodocyclales bacterium]
MRRNDAQQKDRQHQRQNPLQHALITRFSKNPLEHEHMIKTEFVDGLEVFSCLPSGKTQHQPLLFVHGAFAGGWMWTETFMPYFAAAGYPCYALSLRGHGNSAGREQIAWHSVSDYVDDVKTVIDWLGETPALIGHSMGGFIVQKLLEQRQVPAAILLCSVPPQGLIAAQFHLMLQKPQLFLEINRILSGEYTDIATLREALFSNAADETMLRDWLGRMQTESQRAIWDMSMFNLPNLFAMHRPPMLVLGAEEDVLVPAFLVQSTAHTYGLRAHLFRGMGHAVTHDQGWQHVADTMVNWLNA